MAAFLAKIISKKILGEKLENNFGKEDPYFETVPATRLDGTPSRKKTTKRRKALPPGISEHDGKVLTKVKRRAYRLDMCLFSFAGIKFGWSSVIGIVPGIGDVLDAFMAMMVFRTCQQVEGGLPSNIKTKMLFNIIVDFAVGLVPLIGDIADAIFRANTKNAVVLENYLREKGAKTLQSQGRPPAHDPTDPDEFDRFEEDSDRRSPPHYSSTTPSRQGTQTRQHGNGHSSRQERVPEQSSGGGSWFSKKTQPDLERGERRREDHALPRLPDEARLNGDSRRTKSTLQKNRR